MYIVNFINNMENIMNNKKANKGFTLVEIMIVVVIIGLLAAMAIPAFNKVRETAQNKTITNNLRQLASAAEQYFLEEGETAAASSDIIGTDKYVKAMPTAVAGESYTGLFNIEAGFPELSVSKSDGDAVTYSQ